MPASVRRFWRCLLVLCSLAPTASSWGTTGHHIVALIAESRLSPEVRARVAKLLLDGQFTMAQVSACPDALRSAEKSPIRPEEAFCLKIAPVTQDSGPWHYIDIPIPKPERTIEQYCPQGNCVTGKIQQFRDVLKNSNDEAKRREALMYLIHFMGDIHQPLHCAERRCDQGGNLVHVNVYLKSGERPDRHLHTVWDSDLLDQLMQDAKIANEQDYAAALESAIKPDRADNWGRSSIHDIAWEGWELAKRYVYRTIPSYDYCDPAVKAKPTPATDLTGRYERDGDKVVREQLLKAGVRLAALLEASLTH